MIIQCVFYNHGPEPNIITNRQDFYPMRKKTTVFTLIQLALYFILSSQTGNAQFNGTRNEIHVPADYSTIQAAINAADQGDLIVVDTGTYVENIDFMQKEIFLFSQYIFTGDTSIIAKTIIDGGGKGSVITIKNKEYKRAEINGFTLTNGSGNPDGLGGGIFMANSRVVLSTLNITGNSAVRGAAIFSAGPSDLEMYSVKVSNNLAEEQGAGIQTINTQLLTDNCTFAGNEVTAGGGGAIFYVVSTQSGAHFQLSLKSSGFFENTCTESTAGVYFYLMENASASMGVDIDKCTFAGNSSATNTALRSRGNNIQVRLRNSRFISNQAQTFVGGCGFAGDCSGGVYNCIFLDNVAGKMGTGNAAGASVFANAGIDFLNCVFAGNTAPVGAGLVVGGGGSSNIINCIFADNNTDQIALIDNNNMGGDLKVDYCNIQNGQGSITTNPLSQLIWGEGNLDSDPLFLMSGDDPFELMEGSPCIDAGIPNTTGLNLPPGDMKGNIRIWDGGSGTIRIDMGAYEFGAEPLGIGDPGWNDPYSNHFVLYPNPFSSSVVIKYSLTGYSNVQLIIYDQFGRMVKILVDDAKTKGSYQLNWNPRDLPPGVYLCLLKTNGEISAKKIIKLE